MTEVLLVRHGQTRDSRAGIYSGLRDIGLSKHGAQQAKEWSWLSKSEKRVSFLSSPLRRARESAVIAGIENPVINPDLAEWDLGPIEGENAKIFRQRNAQWDLFRDGPPAPGETLREVVLRARNVKAELLERSQEDMVVAFSHGQFIKVLTMILLDHEVSRGTQYKIGTCRAVRLKMRHDRTFQIFSWNCSAADTRDFKTDDIK